jgi:uncharacterized protein (DUF433 family)
MAVTSLLSRPIYQYSDVDRLVGLRGGTARRWINGYTRNHRTYEPILRSSPSRTEWVTWGEFVETRILAEYREKDIPTARLRAAVEGLRHHFKMEYPLAHLGPYVAAERGDLIIDLPGDAAADDDLARMVLRTGQMLLTERSRRVIDNAILAVDDRGEKFAAELTPDDGFPGIVLNPARFGGQPTFSGRRVQIATIAGMVASGEAPADLAVDYSLSLTQIQAAVEYSSKHRLIA